jgi:hypothetical protein
LEIALNRTLSISWILALCFCAAGSTVPAFAGDGPTFGQLNIPRLTTAPKLEDFLDMKPTAGWESRMLQVEGLKQRIPSDGAPVSQRTVISPGYHEKNLYAVFVCFDKEPEKIRARLGRREDIITDDSVEIMLDTFHDHRRAYSFLSNPLGVQADALWTEGQENGFDFSFDTVWDSSAKRTPQGYVVWMAIPFRSLRFTDANPQSWGIILNRGIPRNNEDTFWPEYTTRISGRLNQEGTLNGLEHISPGRNLQLIPYGIFESVRDLDLRDPNHPTYSRRTAQGRIGLDAKYVLQDKFVLDATVNPDFSQVESDEPQVTASQRFEVVFPEKRPFFLENSNYFLTPINLMFTRRIANPDFGVRLTGKDGPYALGFLVADDKSPGREVPPGDPLANQHAYFAIGRVSRDIGSQSTVGLLYTDREFQNSFNRVGGVDTRIRLNSNWTTSGQAVVSATRNLDGSYLAGPAFHMDVRRQGRSLTYIFDYEGRANGFHTDSGFDPQPGIHTLDTVLQYTFHPEGKRLITWGPVMEVSRIYDHDGNRLNTGYFPELTFEFPRQTFLQLFYAIEGELLRPKDFSVLTHNKDFQRATREITLKTDYFRQVGLQVDYRWGNRVNYAPAVGQEPFLAWRSSLDMTATVRPSSKLKIDNTYLLFRLRDRITGAAVFNDHILRSKWNYQFTRALSLRLIGQYSAFLGNPQFTLLPSDKNLNWDFLATYLVHPSTAIYVGYNSNLQNLDPALALEPDGYIRRRPGQFINDGRHFFVKASYLFRF